MPTTHTLTDAQYRQLITGVAAALAHLRTCHDEDPICAAPGAMALQYLTLVIEWLPPRHTTQKGR